MESFAILLVFSCALFMLFLVVFGRTDVFKRVGVLARVMRLSSALFNFRAKRRVL